MPIVRGPVPLYLGVGQAGAQGILYIYALTFTGLNFHSFLGSAAIRESFILQKFRPVWQRVCRLLDNWSQKCNNTGNSLGQLDMQLRTSTEAIDYINQ